MYRTVVAAAAPRRHGRADTLLAARVRARDSTAHTALPRTSTLWSTAPMRILHTMLRVNNLDESLAFYTEVLGMKLLSKTEFPSGKFTLAFVGYGDEATHAVLELTYNWDRASYQLGDAFGHVALGVDDVYATCAALRARGAKITREPGPMKHGTSVIAFIEDPNGYKIELVQNAAQA